MLPEGKSHVLPYRERIKKGAVLKQHSEAPADLVELRVPHSHNIFSINDNGPSIRLLEPDHEPDQDRFSCTGPAYDSRYGPGCYIEAYPVQDLLTAVPLVDVLHPDH